MTDPSSDGANGRRDVAVLVNPRAGSRGQRHFVLALQQALRARALSVSCCWDRDELAELVRLRGDTLRCVVAAGGDGTLNDVVNRAPGVPVAVLPLGNQNLVARHFRIGRSASALAEAIASAPARLLDLGRASGRLFSLMAGVGIDARVVHDVHRHRSGHINKLTYVVPTLRAMWEYRFPTIEVEVEETGERLHGAMAFLFNLPDYGLGLPVGLGARADDGWLDLFVFQRPGVVNLARYLGAVLCRRHECLPDVQHRRVKRVRLWSDHPVPVQLDGDPAGTLPATIEVVPAGMRLLA